MVKPSPILTSLHAQGPYYLVMYLSCSRNGKPKSEYQDPRQRINFCTFPKEIREKKAKFISIEANQLLKIETLQVARWKLGHMVNRVIHQMVVLTES